MIDHVGFTVSDFERSKAFYGAVLGALGIEPMMQYDVGGVRHMGFGRGKPDFWISSGQPMRGRLHVAFLARSRAEVHAFHTVALGLGAIDNGAPGIRPHYHPNYYGAFVLDPDGHNVEAVCHGKE
ncbi:VOC family protein [Arsenicitalea aurantiaca]|uniref:VOC family protein n=1 Tax=Arsenicitalea aurantiaca TaxID=1783274 RepID=A0A433XBK8_9HYPH|nr:VOC family protein [Arsenicitalea aurantiaca]RUT31434.1 VOC family protein [Arsenicitalea aurantiaca]